MRGISHSILNPRTFSHSSVLQSAFLGPPRRSKLENNTLEKRTGSYAHSPQLTDDQLHKRPRHAAPKEDVWSGHDHLPAPELGQPEPWHQNDRFVRKFKREELERAVALTSTVSTPIDQFPFGNDDEFPIHPIFRSLTGLVTELYPSLRLATRLILSRRTLPFFHNLITCPLVFLQPESQYYNTPLTHIAPSPYQGVGLSDAERDLTINTLLFLVPHIALQISPDPRLSVRWAYTERATPPQHPTTGLASAYRTLPQLFPTPAHLHETNNPYHPLLALNFQGTNALINISPSFLRILHPHTFPQPSAAQRLRASFMLAVTLVHELAHAVYMCRFPGPPLLTDTDPPKGSLPPPPPTQNTPAIPVSYRATPATPQNNKDRRIVLSNGKPFPHPTRRPFFHPHPHAPSSSSGRHAYAYTEHEPFYATHRKPELGHAWETTVFGSGRILSLASCDRFTLGLGWQRWPGADEFHVHNARGEVVPLCRRPAEGYGRGGGGGGPPKYETVYPLSDAWVWQWFLRGFWERVEVEGLHTGTTSNNGRSGVGRVEKKLGARVRNYDWVGGGDGGDGWESDCSSRGRGADGDGVVREGQVGVESEGESDEEESESESEEEDGVD